MITVSFLIKKKKKKPATKTNIRFTFDTDESADKKGRFQI